MLQGVSGQAVCIHNASTGREQTLPHNLARSTNGKKKVVVVGAGPGGLEAARVAAERGHAVTVFEASSKAGGQVVLTAALKRRREIMGIVDWRIEECSRLGVHIKYDHYAGVEDVLAETPDYVVVATGGLPNLDLLSSGDDLATTSWDVLSGAVTPAGSVLLCDNNGSHQGMTIAEFVAKSGVDLEVVTPERTLAPDIGATNYPVYFRALNEANAKITLNLRLERLERRGNKVAAIFEDEYAKRWVEKEADHVIVEYGTTPLDELYFELKEQSINRGEVDYRALVSAAPQAVSSNADGQFHLYRIGDAVASRNIHAAILEGYRLMATV